MANTEAWGSRVGLILAMAGNAVGLGNFLRFPVQAIQNGGGAFIIPYLVCFLLMGLPLLFVEWSSGRFGGSKGHHSTPFIFDAMDRKKFWKYIGVFGIFTNVAVAAYYCYLESWTLSWVWNSVTGTFSGQTQAEVATYFGNYVSLENPDHSFNAMPIIFWLICLLLNTWILSRGLSGGVEKAAKIGMPLLLIFGAFLAYKAVTIQAGSEGASFDGVMGLNFLWTPDYSSIWSSQVWLAAAGQVFFTLSLGMGSIQCYASYIKKKDDIALNAMSAGWMNEFVEVVLGSAILIPIAVGYLGIDRVVEMTSSGGLGLGFMTMPYLFDQWGAVMAVIAGVFWFGLLFFAGITSSLAMGTPVMGFLQDEYGWKRKPAAWAFGGIVLLLGLPTVLFFNEGVFDEYDYWAGTVSLVVFALFEIILFAWVFGMDKGWKEITSGSDIKVPNVFKFIIKYITPVLLAFVFVKSLPGIWDKIMNKESHDKIETYMHPELVTQQIIDLRAELSDVSEDVIYGEGVRLNTTLSADQKTNIFKLRSLEKTQTELLDPAFDKDAKIAAEKKSIFYRNVSRAGLLALWLGIAYLVYRAYKKRIKEGRFTS
jgi:NSS family neurotransmitter:Na+ symporter